MPCELSVRSTVRIPSKQILATADRALRMLGYDTKAVTLSVALVGDAVVSRLNRQYRKHQGTTDVLSFPGVGDQLGEIIISVPQARRQAQQFGHPLITELNILLIHGILHVCGYTHGTPRTRSRMQALEQRLLAGNSLIHRSS